MTLGGELGRGSSEPSRKRDVGDDVTTTVTMRENLAREIKTEEKSRKEESGKRKRKRGEVKEDASGRGGPRVHAGSGCGAPPPPANVKTLLLLLFFGSGSMRYIPKKNPFSFSHFVLRGGGGGRDACRLGRPANSAHQTSKKRP